jgi:hypothetical protein
MQCDRHGLHMRLSEQELSRTIPSYQGLPMLTNILIYSVVSTVVLHALLITPVVLSIFFKVDQVMKTPVLRWLLLKNFWKATDYIWLSIAILGAQSFYDLRRLEAAVLEQTEQQRRAFFLIYSPFPEKRVVALPRAIAKFQPSAGFSNIDGVGSLIPDYCDLVAPERYVCTLSKASLLAIVGRMFVGNEIDLRALRALIAAAREFDIAIVWRSRPLFNETTRPRDDPFIINPEPKQPTEIAPSEFERRQLGRDLPLVKEAFARLAEVLESSMLEYERAENKVRDFSQRWSIVLRDYWSWLIAWILAIRITKTTAELLI